MMQILFPFLHTIWLLFFGLILFNNDNQKEDTEWHFIITGWKIKIDLIKSFTAICQKEKKSTHPWAHQILQKKKIKNE